MKKIARKYYEGLQQFEKDYVHQRARVDDISTIKMIINQARREYPGYVKIYGKGFIELQSGETFLWTGRDTRRFVKIEKETKQNESMHPLDQLKKQIKTQLDLCESQETPTVCAIKEDPDGYQELEKLIIDKVMYGNDPSIANAIVEVENEFNANSYAE